MVTALIKWRMEKEAEEEIWEKEDGKFPLITFVLRPLGIGKTTMSYEFRRNLVQTSLTTLCENGFSQISSLSKDEQERILWAAFENYKGRDIRSRRDRLDLNVPKEVEPEESSSTISSLSSPRSGPAVVADRDSLSYSHDANSLRDDLAVEARNAEKTRMQHLALEGMVEAKNHKIERLQVLLTATIATTVGLAAIAAITVAKKMKG